MATPRFQGLSSQGPRIRGVDADTLRRVFQSPETAPPTLSAAETQSLIEAIQGRELREKQRQAKIAQIEKSLALAEQEEKLGTLLTKPPQAPDRPVETTQFPGLTTAQVGAPTAPGVTPSESVQEAEQRGLDLDTAQEIQDIETQMDPLGRLERDRQKEATQGKLQSELILIREKAKQKRLEKQTERQEKSKVSAKKISALGNSKIFATEGFQNLVNELTSGEKAVPKSVLSRLGVKADSLTGGNLSAIANAAGRSLGFGDIIKSRPEAILFDQQRESLAVAVYKFVSGDVGNIAASESKRALKLIPAVTDTQALRDAKIQGLQRAASRAKEALDTLINDPESALLSAKELDQRQRAIADEALATAAVGIPESESAKELVEAQGGEEPDKNVALEQFGVTPEALDAELRRRGLK